MLGDEPFIPAEKRFTPMKLGNIKE